MGCSPTRLRSPLGMLLLALVVWPLAGCIDNTVDPELVEVDFLVGQWEAEEMQMISVSNPDRTVDLIQAFDASFSLQVQSSGRYTAELALGAEQPVDETGSLSVEGDSLVFTPDAGAVSRSHYEVADDGQLLILDGPSEFDFDGDLEPDPATLHIELRFL